MNHNPDECPRCTLTRVNDTRRLYEEKNRLQKKQYKLWVAATLVVYIFVMAAILWWAK